MAAENQPRVSGEVNGPYLMQAFDQLYRLKVATAKLDYDLRNVAEFTLNDLYYPDNLMALWRSRQFIDPSAIGYEKGIYEQDANLDQDPDLKFEVIHGEVENADGFPLPMISLTTFQAMQAVVREQELEDRHPPFVEGGEVYDREFATLGIVFNVGKYPPLSTEREENPTLQVVDGVVFVEVASLLWSCPTAADLEPAYADIIELFRDSVVAASKSGLPMNFCLAIGENLTPDDFGLADVF